MPDGPGRDQSPSPRPLPGARPDIPPGMANYVVILRDDGAPPPAGRREVYEHHVSRAARVRETILRWVDEHDLTAQVAGVGEAMGFPLLTLTATPAVARGIEQLPEVEVVFEDSPGAALLR